MSKDQSNDSRRQNPPPDGRPDETPNSKPSQLSTSVWPPTIEHRKTAAKWTRELFRFCEPPDRADKGDVEKFLSAAIAIFTEFPVQVMQSVANPSRGLPSRKSRPELCDIRAACEEVFAPLARQFARDKIAAEQRARLAAPAQEEKPTAEEMQTRLKSLGGEADSHADDDLKAHKRDDPTDKEKQAALDGAQRAKTDRIILQAYATQNLPPRYLSTTDPGWSRVLISPSLAKLVEETKPRGRTKKERRHDTRKDPSMEPARHAYRVCKAGDRTAV